MVGVCVSQNRKEFKTTRSFCLCKQFHLANKILFARSLLQSSFTLRASSSFSSFCFIFPHHPSHDCVLRRWVSLHFCGEFIAVHRDLCHTPFHHPPPQRRGRAPLQEDINYDMSIKKLASHIEMEEGNACFALSVRWKNIFIFFFFEKTEQGYSQLDEITSGKNNNSDSNLHK